MTTPESLDHQFQILRQLHRDLTSSQENFEYLLIKYKSTTSNLESLKLYKEYLEDFLYSSSESISILKEIMIEIQEIDLHLINKYINKIQTMSL